VAVDHDLLAKRRVPMHEGGHGRPRVGRRGVSVMVVDRRRASRAMVAPAPAVVTRVPVMNDGDDMMMMVVARHGQRRAGKDNRRHPEGDRGEGPGGVGHGVFPCESRDQATRALSCFNTLGTSRGKSSLINPAPKVSAQAPWIHAPAQAAS